MDASLWHMVSQEEAEASPSSVVPSPAGPPDKLSIQEMFYIYRWGVSPTHLSGRTDDEHYADIGDRPITPGTFTITPHWVADYVATTRGHLAQRNTF